MSGVFEIAEKLSATLLRKGWRRVALRGKSAISEDHDTLATPTILSRATINRL
jgi:hypothetical protein